MLRDISARLDDLEVKELLACSVFPDPDQLDEAVEAYRKPNGLELFGYEEEGELVGLVGFETAGDQVVVKHIAVSPEHRGKDYGRGMIIELLLAKKPKELVAETDEESLGFYRSLGFQIYSLGEMFPGIERFRCVYDAAEEEEEN